MRRARDVGSVTAAMVLMIVVVLGGAGLIVDGGRAMSARRHASNTAEAAARAAVSTATPISGIDPDRARSAAIDHAMRAGVAVADVEVVVGTDSVTVTVTERRRTVFLVLGGQSTLTVNASGTARAVYSEGD